MFYRYRMTEEQSDFYLSSDRFFTRDEVSQIELEPCEDEDKLFEDDWWCVHDADGLSSIPADCKDIAEARKILREALNTSIYERIHDL